MDSSTYASQRIIVVTAGLGTPSSSRLLADMLAENTVRQLHSRGLEATVETIELRNYAVDIANTMVTFFPTPRLAEVIDAVTEADALIAVTPVFTASMSGLFKSFFDVLDNKALIGKPMLIGATGGSARHSMVLDHAMRPMFTYLRAALTPTGVFAAPEDWGGGSVGDGQDTALNSRAARAAGELALLLRPRQAPGGEGQTGPAASATGQGAGQEPDPWHSLPFEELLARTRG